MIFVDTGAFLARYLKRDQFFENAQNQWASIRKEAIPLVTTNLILVETATLLSRRTGPDVAVAKVRSIYQSRSFMIHSSAKEDELAGLDLISQFRGQDISLTDGISFVVMRKLGITRAFSFDHHFLIAGFELFELDHSP